MVGTEQMTTAMVLGSAGRLSSETRGEMQQSLIFFDGLGEIRAESIRGYMEITHDSQTPVTYFRYR
jgi:hypothetical protein